MCDVGQFASHLEIDITTFNRKNQIYLQVQKLLQISEGKIFSEPIFATHVDLFPITNI